MAAPLIIEDEFGTCAAAFRHSQNGYGAGDFSATPRIGSELRLSHAKRRDVPRAELSLLRPKRMAPSSLPKTSRAAPPTAIPAI